jgi:hypothetical protein
MVVMRAVADEGTIVHFSASGAVDGDFPQSRRARRGAVAGAKVLAFKARKLVTRGGAQTDDEKGAIPSL